jgi:hypothetical protein
MTLPKQWHTIILEMAEKLCTGQTVILQRNSINMNIYNHTLQFIELTEESPPALFKLPTVPSASYVTEKWKHQVSVI